MPILAVAAAVAADVGVASTVGGIIAGTAALTVTSALEITAAVGATVGAIGAVTHDKTLSTVGMVLGGIGGVGALASSAGLFGADAAAGAPLFGDSSSISDIEPVTVTPPAASIGADGLDAAGAAPVASVQSGQLPDIVNTLGGVNPTTPAPASDIDSTLGAASGNPSDIEPVTVTKPAASIGGDTSNLVPTGAASTPGLNPASSAVNATPPSSAAIAGGTSGAPIQAPKTPGTDTSASESNAALGIPPPNPGIGQTMTGADGNTYSYDGSKWVEQKGFFNNLMSSPGAQYGLIQAAGSFISGATSTLTPAQVAALNAQAAQNNAAAKLSQTQQTNMAQPIPTASRAITPNVTGQPAGLINTPPPGAVTGAPAT